MKTPLSTASSAIQVFEPDPDAIYSIETASRMTHIPRRRIAVYCRHRLISPAADPERGGWFFDNEAIQALRRIERLRAEHGADLTAIGLIFELVRRVEELQEEVRFLRA